MSFNFSKSQFVSTCTRCNKYAWLEKNKSDKKADVNEFTESLFDNGHKVGELAKQYFNIDADVTVLNKNDIPDTYAMVRETKKHLAAGTRVIAEASFDYNGFFCSVDILIRNNDGSYNIYEVKSSKRNLEREQLYDGVKEAYVIDAAYQQYVLEQCSLKINKVIVVLLSETYVRGKLFEIDKYFVQCDVTRFTTEMHDMVVDKLAEIGTVLSNSNEPPTEFTRGCNGCDYFKYCSESIPSPSPFDLYGLDFTRKCVLYNRGISFFVAQNIVKLRPAALKQIEYYNRPNDAYVDKDKIREFLNTLRFPLYSLDFETYQAIVPEFEGMKISEAVPFQYSLHIIKTPDGDYSIGSPDLDESHFLDVTGGDPRRAIAESLVRDIPRGSCVVACHKSTEKGIIEKLAATFSDLADHLLSFEYVDPQPLFQNGYYYVKAMGGSFSLKSILPALYPNDPEMNYHNLQGSVKNGTQAMTAIMKVSEVSEEERNQIEEDLIKYCALDTFAVVKIIKKLYDVSK